MLWEHRFGPLIAAGEVTVTFRRWKKRQVVPGNRYRTPGGMIEVDEVEEVDAAAITDADARRAGHASAAALVADLPDRPGLPLYRIRFHHVGADPRDALAADADLDATAVAEIDAKLDRLDQASSYGPWTGPTLRIIRDRPAVRAPDLAAGFGRETQPFKRDVRKLKNLGLTISLNPGYRLSPRGEAFLRMSPRGTDSN